MARELIPTPTDEHTGMPLPILLPEPAQLAAEPNINYHHNFFPRKDLRLYYGEGSRALRYSRGQELPVWLHTRFHQHFDGPPLPDRGDIDEQFRMAVLGCAGIVGPHALDLTQDDLAEPVLLTPAQQAYITQPRYMHTESALHSRRARRINTYIGTFFAKYTIGQELGHMQSATIEEFLETRDANRKKELGNLLLREAVQVAVEPVARLEPRLRDEGYMLPSRASAVVRKFFNKTRFGDYHSELASRLRGEPAFA